MGQWEDKSGQILWYTLTYTDNAIDDPHGTDACQCRALRSAAEASDYFQRIAPARPLISAIRLILPFLPHPPNLPCQPV